MALSAHLKDHTFIIILIVMNKSVRDIKTLQKWITYKLPFFFKFNRNLRMNNYKINITTSSKYFFA